jgi:uncharacterized protein (DUF1330 family)
MPGAYWVVTYRSLKNPAAWRAYAEIAKPAIAASGGRFLALTKPVKTYELGMNETVVLIEFDDAAKAIACHDSPSYQQALKALGSGNVERDIRIVEGVA